MSRGCFASVCTSCPDSGRWTGLKRNASSLLCTAFASSGLSLSFLASSARICPLALPRSPPTGDFATGVLAILALLTVRIRPLFWLFVVAFNLVGAADIILDYYHAIQVGASCDGWGSWAPHMRSRSSTCRLLMITHVVALYWLVRPQPKAARALGGDAAAS